MIEHPEYGEVIQLQGDQRKNICQFLLEVSGWRPCVTNVHEIGSRVVSALTENGEAHAQLTLQPSGLLLGLGTVPRIPVRVCKCTRDRWPVLGCPCGCWWESAEHSGFHFTGWHRQGGAAEGSRILR